MCHGLEKYLDYLKKQNSDSIFQSSSALRHAAESSPEVEESGVPILASVADGGPDHNVRHGQTQVALISSFQRHNLDMLVAINTCPGNSWANPPERVMSLWPGMK